MRQDEEKLPILGNNHKGSKSIKSAFELDDRRTTLNGTPDDFYDLKPTKDGSYGQVGDDSSPGGGTFGSQFTVLSVVIILLSVGHTVGVPVWIAGLVTHRSDPFTVSVILPTFGMLATLAITLVFRKVRLGGEDISLYPFFLKSITVYGLLTSFGLVLQAFCGVPSRTPAYVQACCTILTLPAACVTKYCLTKKAFSSRQSFCLLSVIVAIALVMINLAAHPDYIPGARPKSLSRLSPDANVLFVESTANLTSPADATNVTTPAPPEWTALDEVWSPVESVFWALGYASSFLLYGISFALLDDPIRIQRGHPMVVCLYSHLMTFLWVVFLFFFDLIPVFGLARTLADFRHHLHHGVKCLFGADTDCAELAWRGWLELLFATGVSIVRCYLIAVSEGPVYTIVATLAAVPISAIVWLCVADSGLALLWYPSFTSLSVLVFIAAILLMPLVFVYQYCSQKDDREKFNQL